MEFKEQIFINAPVEKVWGIITNIEGSADNISAIQDIKVLENPADGIVGFKWTETRIMFGKTATETMWITDAKTNEFYQTRAESHGAIYISKLNVIEKDGGTILTMSFIGEAQTFMAKLMSATLGAMFKKATRKALTKDLEDIKSAAEK